jgi:DNA-binding response OmpR family regulator
VPALRANPAAFQAPPLSGEVVGGRELEIAVDGGLARANGRVVPLSAREHAVLVSLATRRGHIVGRPELYSLVWGGELRPGDRSVDVYVSKLRNKLAAAMPDRRFIHTHVRFGYRFDPEPASDGAGTTTRRLNQSEST